MLVSCSLLFLLCMLGWHVACGLHESALPWLRNKLLGEKRGLLIFNKKERTKDVIRSCMCSVGLLLAAVLALYAWIACSLWVPLLWLRSRLLKERESYSS